jgi:hypothetical protein
VQNYEIWSVNQGCEQVSYADLPENLKVDVAHVFDVRGRIPATWVNKVSTQLLITFRCSCTEGLCLSNQKDIVLWLCLLLKRFLCLLKTRSNSVLFYFQTPFPHQTCQNYTLRSSPYFLPGSGCAGCVNLRKNGLKLILLQMCMHYSTIPCIRYQLSEFV